MTERIEQEVLPVSLIICSRNRPVLLEQVVTSVISGRSVPAEIVIIDQSDAPHPGFNGVVDRACTTIRYNWKTDAGLSKARNAAIAVAQYDLFAYIDDDELAPREWLGTLIRKLNTAGTNCIVTGQVKPGAPEIPGGFSPSTITEEQPAVYSGRLDRDVLYAGNMAMSREVLRVLGGFDERLGVGTRFPGAEDNDFGLRLLQAGYKILYIPEAFVYHRAWRNQYLSVRWRYGRGQGAFYAKYINDYNRYGVKRLRSDIRKYALRGCYRLRRERRKAFGDVIYICGLLSGASEWLLRYGWAN
jgi:GT2 family glycosyltransferase